MDWVIMNMENPNTLVSLAYIKVYDNPLSVFCNYILYSLMTSSDSSLRADQLKQKIAERFGLNMPQTMVDNCIQILKRSGEVEVLPGGKGYSIISTQFDIQNFESNMRRLHEQEEAVLQSISEFVKDRFRLDWSTEQAKEYLSAFLNEEGNGARLFLSQEPRADYSKVSPSWYIGRYISDAQSNANSPEKIYLEEIVNGMMIYQGIYQTNNYRQNKDQKFKGTVFFLDTKLVLRMLGFSWDAHVQATRELVDLITKKYEGRIGVFPQTVTEVRHALTTAACCYKNSKPIADEELKMYSELQPRGSVLFEEVAISVTDILEENYNVIVSPSINWNTPDVIRHSINTDEIKEYILNQHNWRVAAVENDVQIINQINILRKGDYSVRYGGKAKRPVFLTTNTDLVFSFKEYVSSALETGSSVKWNVHALPVIADNMVLFRLWVPHASQYSNLPALTLARYAYAAQNPTTQSFEKMRELASLYKTQQGVYRIDLSEMRRRQLEDILIVKSHGDLEQITSDMVALSYQEMMKMDNVDLNDKVKALSASNQSRAIIIDNMNKQIVRLAAKPYVDKLGLWRGVIWAARFWWVIAAIVLAFASTMIEKALTLIYHPSG